LSDPVSGSGGDEPTWLRGSQPSWTPPWGLP
jgi:hypothetical protein